MDFPFHIPFVKTLGICLERLSDGEAELSLTSVDSLTNSVGAIHGGVTMTLLDVAMVLAARSVFRDRPDFGPTAVTMEMKTSFLSPGRGRLQASGRLLQASPSVAFCEAWIVDEADRRCAHATGTFKYLKSQWEKPPGSTAAC